MLSHGFVKIDMDFSKLLNGFVNTDILISLSCYKNLSKLIHEEVVLSSWVSAKKWGPLAKL